MLASLAGVLYVAPRERKPDPGAGSELEAIAAAVIGGINLMGGGKGSITDTLVGVRIFGFLGNILQLRNIDGNTQLVLKGIIITAVMLQEANMRLWLTRALQYLRGDHSSDWFSAQN